MLHPFTSPEFHDAGRRGSRLQPRRITPWASRVLGRRNYDGAQIEGRRRLIQPAASLSKPAFVAVRTSEGFSKCGLSGGRELPAVAAPTGPTPGLPNVELGFFGSPPAVGHLDIRARVTSSQADYPASAGLVFLVSAAKESRRMPERFDPPNKGKTTVGTCRLP